MRNDQLELSVAHRINRKLWPFGAPVKRVTLAELRARERATNRKLKQMGGRYGRT
ncbi:hypothetical protein [Sphingobium yanoikuyae]|uniref:hypothetical protein n=1 Tax=Sphingobium yanoikuyae TaxID=13690 RepID=UPI0035C7B102